MDPGRLVTLSLIYLLVEKCGQLPEKRPIP
jgi:hypothetical protein